MGDCLWGEQVMIEDKERYADPIDAGSANADTWLADQIAEHRYQLERNAQAFEAGRCRNCNDNIDDGRAYCDESCRNDHQARIASDKRNGKYRGS